MTDTVDLLNLTVDALKGKTSVMNNIFSPRDWPTWSGSYPLILVQTPSEEKTSLGKSAPEFNVVSTFQITARVQALATPRDGGGELVEARLIELRKQIERALINNYELTKAVQQFPFVRSQMSISDEGEYQIGELVMHIGMEFYQGPEDFYPVERFPINDVSLTIVEPIGTAGPSLDIKLS